MSRFTRPADGTREVRCVELRAEGVPESRTITGRAVVFNTPTVIAGCYREVIAADAITDELLQRSDVVLTLEHDLRAGVLGRYNAGQGTMQLERRDDGIYMTCDLPETALGDAVLAGVRRGDYSHMSFAFSVGQSEWSEDEDGIDLRTITKVSQLYDVSVVAFPAYSDTSLTARSAEEPETDDEPDDEPDDETAEEPEEEEEEEEVIETSNEEEDMPEKRNAPASQPEQTQVQQPDEQRNRQEGQPAEQRSANNEFVARNRQRRSSAEAPSLMRIIRSQMRNGAPMTEVDQALCRSGEQMMRNANLDFGGGIVLPVENRADGGSTSTTSSSTAIVAGTATFGAEAVATDTLNILGPLYDNLVLAQAGATMLTGLVGNLRLPTYSGSSAGWAGEIASASDGKGSFADITFSPKRLTAYIDVSNQFLIQDSVNAEALLRQDLAMAIRQKLEATLLGNAAGSTTQPAGMFNGVTDQITPTYKEMIKLEQTLEEKNVTGELHYIMSPAIKAALRGTAKDTGSGRFLMEGPDVNGIPALVTNNAKGIVLGNFADYVVCQWGGIELIVDTLTKATEGTTRIVINSYWDAKPRRATFAKATLKTT